MLANLTGWHLLIIVFLVLLLFGAPKLPGLAKSVGQSMKIFKNEIKSDKVDTTDTSASVPPATTPSTPAAPTPAPTETTASGSHESHTKP
ncbi:sec-independent protein translocase protein TatA [Okibacterium sp. HSC-33S16]|uniref:twin-arginine translocase TatA/TatE family subunit n=1 Tax=Okibacterium sp. HSC-33S16 TaxID=2910965 RepID=UPI00209F8940|nr:twin-arginine translocase TatA/TatE family subunit [Okibacterium sp. HSC-33S16]MCP2032798.1 sec-independent protein translocase protein TatA [Okibacterium sp. HSC-33S16]